MTLKTNIWKKKEESGYLMSRDLHTVRFHIAQRETFATAD